MTTHSYSAASSILASILPLHALSYTYTSSHTLTCQCDIHSQVWAYANLGYDPGALMDAIAQCSEYRMQEFSPQNISNILWAYAKLGM